MVPDWPPFTMSYTEQRFDSTGALTADRTFQVVVQDEFHWDLTLIRDGLMQGNVGRTVGQHSRFCDPEHPLEECMGGFGEWLSPFLYYRATNPKSVWAQVAPQTDVPVAVSDPSKGRVAYLFHGCLSETPPGGECKATDTDDIRAEFDVASIAVVPGAGKTVPIGGITVFAEEWFGGRLIALFTANSLVLGPPPSSTP
jgi:hypothetical protein